MKSSNGFWNQFFNAYLGNDSIQLPSSQLVEPEGINPIIKAGKNTHVIELLDAYRVSSEKSVDIPDRLLEESRKDRSRNTHRNARFRELMQQIDEASGAYDVDYAWLKGAVFLQNRSYPKGGRRLSDLDLLIQKQDLKAWDNLFNDLGYETHRDPEWILSPRFSSSVASTFYTKYYRGMEVLIDVHWHLVDYPARRYSGYWDFTMDPIWDRVSVKTLGLEHRLLYLIDHAFTHNFTYWKFIVDIDTVLRETNESIDWPYLRNEASRMNMTFLLSLLRKFLRALLGRSPLPGELERLVSGTRGIGEDESWMDDYVTDCRDLNADQSDYLLVCLRMLPDFWSRVLFLRYVLFPPPAGVPMIRSESDWYDAAKLYLTRLKRVLKQGGTELLRG
ncbi:MAG: nucleotidyltransferase family protein [bacterium]